jgi:glycosyltransferase involved in cell wall biosynthesis
LVNKNYDVTLFTSNDERSEKFEKIDGLNIIRRGGFVTVYFWAILYYIFRFRNRFDLIIDCENGIPFFTPLYSLKPVILVVHHVHQDVFFSNLIPPFSWIANFLETFLMPQIYRKSRVIAVSPSTAEELNKNIGINADQIITNGVDTSLFHTGLKTRYPLISYVGRIKKYKSLDVLIRSFHQIIKDHPKAKLVIAGEGDAKNNFKKLTEDLQLASQISFVGRISEKEKIKLLGKSWVMVQPSFQEGFGISCLEANACYTPVLASNVPGLRDAVSDGRSGYLFAYGDSQELYLKLKDLITNNKKRAQLEKSSRLWSEKFSWDTQSDKFEGLVTRTTKPHKPHRH